MGKYYLSLHSKSGKEYEDAVRLCQKLEAQHLQRTNDPYEANTIVAFFYGDAKEETRVYAVEMKLLELIHEKNPEARIFVAGPMTELVDFSKLYPFVTSWTKGKTWSDFAREPGWKGIPADACDDLQRQVMEELKNAKIPKYLMQPESADAAEEVICGWIAIDEIVTQEGLKSKCNTKGFDEELSFSLSKFIAMMSREVIAAVKGELKLPAELTKDIRKVVAKAYK